MKNILVFVIAASLMMASCKTQKFHVSGEPGTIITALDGSTLTVIDQSGTAEIKMDRRDGYDAFLQAKAPGSEKLVPFALDYKNHNRTTPNYILGLVTFPVFGFLIFWSNIGSCFDYDYLQYQHTNNDLIK